MERSVGRMQGGLSNESDHTLATHGTGQIAVHRRNSNMEESSDVGSIPRQDLRVGYPTASGETPSREVPSVRQSNLQDDTDMRPLFTPPTDIPLREPTPPLPLRLQWSRSASRTGSLRTPSPPRQTPRPSHRTADDAAADDDIDLSSRPTPTRHGALDASLASRPTPTRSRSQRLVYTTEARNIQPLPLLPTSPDQDRPRLGSMSAPVSTRSSRSSSPANLQRNGFRSTIIAPVGVNPTIPPMNTEINTPTATSTPPLPLTPLTQLLENIPDPLPSFPTLTQSAALLSSLRTLRTTLHQRVESLNLEVDRLRRRAEELEMGITERGQEVGGVAMVAEGGVVAIEAGGVSDPIPGPVARPRSPPTPTRTNLPSFPNGLPPTPPRPTRYRTIPPQPTVSLPESYPARSVTVQETSRDDGEFPFTEDELAFRAARAVGRAERMRIRAAARAAVTVEDFDGIEEYFEGGGSARGAVGPVAGVGVGARGVAEAQKIEDGRKSGSGSCEIEGGSWKERRERRLAALLARNATALSPSDSVLPIISAVPTSSARTAAQTADSIIPRESNWTRPRQFQLYNAEEYETALLGSPSPSSSPLRTINAGTGSGTGASELAELQRLRDLLDQSAADRRRMRARMDVMIGQGTGTPSSTAGGTGETGHRVDQSLTSRGRRVESSISNSLNSAQTGTAQTLATRQQVNAMFTRYRDALIADPMPNVPLPQQRATGSAADSIPTYPGMARGISAQERLQGERLEASNRTRNGEESVMPSVDSAMAARLAESGRAGGPGEAAGTSSVGVDVAQDILTAARTTDELNNLSRLVAGLRERLQGLVRQSNERTRARAPVAASAVGTRAADVLDRLAERSRARRPETPPQLSDRESSPRRPSYPFAHTSSHPHHRPRIGPDPIAAVINLDNHNSFDLNFDGNIIFRPIAVREPDRELIARCLSMLPGGRDDTPSRWMRLTGAGTNRPRRASATAGFWVRWVSEPESEGAGIRHRQLDMANLPRIIAFDFSICPSEDDAFVRADEVEFHTPRTRFRRHVGPWMHSRVRIAPFESDPPIARWGTSSHVRQAVRSRGGLNPGDHLTLHLRTRTVDVVRHLNASRPATSRGLAQPGVATNVASSTSDGQINPITLSDNTSRGPIATTEAGDDANAWLMAYEPAIGQIRAHWRAHYRRQYSGESHPPVEARIVSRVLPRTTQDAPEIWSRDFLDADGMPLPSIALMPTGLSRESSSNDDSERQRDAPHDPRAPQQQDDDAMQVNYV